MSDTARPRPSARRRGPAPAAEEATGSPARSTAVVEPRADEVPETPAPAGGDPSASLRRISSAAEPAAEPAAGPAAEPADDAPRRHRRRISVPLVPVLGVLLLALLAVNAFLLVQRLSDEGSSVRTDSYVDVLQAARSNVVDLTSFDHLTIDEDIEQARRVTTGELTDETVQSLEDARQALVDGQAVTSTEVVGAGVTRATEDEGTVVMVISTTRQGNGVPAQVSRSRIEVDLVREGDRWLLSAIRGTGPDD